MASTIVTFNTSPKFVSTPGGKYRRGVMSRSAGTMSLPGASAVVVQEEPSAGVRHVCLSTFGDSGDHI